MSETANKTPYDEVPYKSYPYPQTHPERLATIASLLGLQPTPINNCRVLEIGCASGGNLLPMAERMPNSEFVGIDLSSRQIDEGKQHAQDAGLDNAQLLHRDLQEIGDDLGKFDYVISHGVYSWIPDNAQEALMAACSHLLTAHGVAYISYNTFPGWHMRGMIREVMSYRSRHISNPEERVRQARNLLSFLAESAPGKDDAYGLMLRKELKLLQGKADYYLLHEHLEENNDPLYFHQFAERAAGHSLQYLAEADFSVMAVENFPPRIEATLRNLGSDIIELEQYMDFVRNRMFRQTLLCHDSVSVDRTLNPDRLLSMHVASRTRPEDPVEDLNDRSKSTFRTPGSVTTTTDPLVKAALLTLGEHWPNYVAFPELLAIASSRAADGASIVDSSRASGEAARLARPLLRCYATGHVNLSVTPPQVPLGISSTPMASQLCRYLASVGNEVTNLRHETVRLDDISRHILPLLDGSRSEKALRDHVVQLCRDQVVIIRERGQIVSDKEALQGVAKNNVSNKLQFFADNALLLA